MKVGILIPVWVNYRWIAPLAKSLIERNWADHPPIWFCGLESSPGEGWNVIPMLKSTCRTNWVQVLLDGVDGMQAQGFDSFYLIAEEHVPLGKCQDQHLNMTIPGIMASRDALYISLMGWDNRRYSSKSPVLPAKDFCLKHLTGPHDPRFHLHPALWRVEAARACCELALREPAAGGSAWHFEKCAARPSAPFPPDWMVRCYQICAASLAGSTKPEIRRLTSWLDRAIFHKLMALAPLLPKPWLPQYVRRIPFDDVFCDGPYPMFYSGIMAKGGLNRYFTKHVGRNNPALMDRILSAMPQS